MTSIATMKHAPSQGHGQRGEEPEKVSIFTYFSQGKLIHPVIFNTCSRMTNNPGVVIGQVWPNDMIGWRHAHLERTLSADVGVRIDRYYTRVKSCSG